MWGADLDGNFGGLKPNIFLDGELSEIWSYFFLLAEKDFRIHKGGEIGFEFGLFFLRKEIRTQNFRKFTITFV
jgi:hypothetical protein